MKKIVVEAEDIGVKNASGFEGRGTSWTNFDAVFIGTATNGPVNAHTALEEAIDQFAWSDYASGLDEGELDAIENPFNPNDPDPDIHYLECPLSDYFQMTEEQEADEDFDPDTCTCEDSELYYYAALWVRVVEEPTERIDHIECGDGMTRHVVSVEAVPDTEDTWLVTDWAGNVYETSTCRIDETEVYWIATKVKDWSENDAS